jgi:hypothetical protein
MQSEAHPKKKAQNCPKNAENALKDGQKNALSTEKMRLGQMCFKDPCHVKTILVKLQSYAKITSFL